MKTKAGKDKLIVNGNITSHRESPRIFPVCSGSYRAGVGK